MHLCWTGSPKKQGHARPSLALDYKVVFQRKSLEAGQGLLVQVGQFRLGSFVVKIVELARPMLLMHLLTSFIEYLSV